MNLNPCDEILLGDPQPVAPWVQVQLMNMLRVKRGSLPYTLEEAKQVEADLLVEYNKEQSNGQT